MTAIGGHVSSSARAGDLGVHSLHEFVLGVPDVAEAATFYHAFGLEVSNESNALALRTFGHEHRWGAVVESARKQLHHLSFGCFPEDVQRLRARIEGNGVRLVDPPPGFENEGFWFRGHDNVLIEVRSAPKSSPDTKSVATWPDALPSVGRAPTRQNARQGRPRRLSHILIFTSDIDEALGFYSRNLGLRLSDRSADIVAFMHGIHGSDHHLLAFVKSDSPGLHHCSWDVGSIDDIGLGAMNMAGKGYAKGWGLGRHVLGSNFFHYVRDPWGSYSEYSCDIDYISANAEWSAGDYPPDDSFYLWGPEVPADFAFNYESPNA
ncbi:VOC family protein [Bradyrhizobium jicamae]|uniref:VOC family protein n=1 Tax=Bradyrhizobium jicamae TaxID=280332 RepID=UPI001BA84BDF|nr:VOC family protein [Bradyrhizobium jicamae]MBR0755323.1 VOC family protein [Bradyrhizobium jicamae]